MVDIGHSQTDEVLESLEKRLAKEYAQAYKEVEKKAADYFARFAEKDKAKKALVDAGKLTEKEYQTWRRNQMLTGKRWNDLRDTLAADLTNVNKIATGIVNGELNEVFAINANYSEYLIENGMRTNYGFTLYDRDTVANLVKNDPDIIPWKPAVDVAADKRWNRQMITSHITQGILQGESIPNLSKRLAKTVNNDKVAAVRTARTAITSSQNAGRQMVYDRAKDMGLKLQKEWMATLDGRTRHDHGRADGQRVPLDGEFTVGGKKMKYPGDMSAPAHLVYNCRCTTITVEPDYITKGEEPRKTYDEWMAEKQGLQQEKQIAPKIETREQAYKALTDEIGFGSVSENVSVIDEKLLAENVTQLKSLNDRFGALTADNSGYFTSTSAPKAVAYSQGNFRNLNHQSMSLCGTSYGKGYDYLISKEKDFVATNWAMPCVDSKLPVYTITHEYGHILENKLIRSMVDMDAFEKTYKAKMLEKNGAKKAMDFLKKEEAKQAKTIWQEIVQIAKDKNPDFLVSKNISEYGKTNYFEAFAETFANSQCGLPNELGTAMNVWLERKGF